MDKVENYIRLQNDNIMYLNKNFKSFLKEFASFSNPKRLELYVKELSTNAYDHAKVTNGHKTIEYEERNMDTGKYESGTLDIDRQLYAEAAKYFDNPAKLSTEIKTSDEIKANLRTLRVTLNEIGKNEFYNNFPAYRAAIFKLGKCLNELKDSVEPYNRLNETTIEPGVKKSKAYELEWILNILETSSDHDSAFLKIKEKLVEEYPQHKWDNFRWTKQQGKLIHVSSGKINGVGASLFLENIAEKLYDKDEVPSAETFRDTLLK